MNWKGHHMASQETEESVLPVVVMVPTDINDETYSTRALSFWLTESELISISARYGSIEDAIIIGLMPILDQQRMLDMILDNCSLEIEEDADDQ